MATMFQLRTTVHFYDPEPGDVNSVTIADSTKVVLKNWRRVEQPYRDLNKFASDERVMQHVIDQGLLPIVLTLSKESFGRKVLVTRRPALRPEDKGVVAYLDGYGIRIQIHLDPESENTIVGWECLYGLA